MECISGTSLVRPTEAPGVLILVTSLCKLGTRCFRELISDSSVDLKALSWMLTDTSKTCAECECSSIPREEGSTTVLLLLVRCRKRLLVGVPIRSSSTFQIRIPIRCISILHIHNVVFRWSFMRISLRSKLYRSNSYCIVDWRQILLSTSCHFSKEL